MSYLTIEEYNTSLVNNKEDIPIPLESKNYSKQ